MSKKSHKQRHRQNIINQRNIAIRQIDSYLRSEPVIRIFDRVNKYEQRKAAHTLDGRKLSKLLAQSPRRQARVRRNLFLKSVFPKEVYEKIHDCKREWSKVLSWRSQRGSGRKRTQRELKNNQQNFKKRDC